MTETVIVSENEKIIRVYRNNQFLQGARCNYAILHESETEKRIVATLNGHPIIDSGFIPKQEFDYEFDDFMLNGFKPHIGAKIGFMNHNSHYKGTLIAFAPNNDFIIQVGDFAYNVKRRNTVSINGYSLVTGNRFED